MSGWIETVKRVYKENRAKNPSYKYKQAMVDAKKVYKSSGTSSNVAEGKSKRKTKKSKKSKKSKSSNKKTRKSRKGGKKGGKKGGADKELDASNGQEEEEEEED